VFKVTAKGKGLKKSNWYDWIAPIQEELFLLSALTLSSIAMLATRGVGNSDAQIWVAMLSLQSLPYISAVACQIISKRENG